MVTIAGEEPKHLKKKAEIPDDTVIQLRLSLDALRDGKVRKFNLKSP